MSRESEEIKPPVDQQGEEGDSSQLDNGGADNEAADYEQGLEEQQDLGDQIFAGQPNKWFDFPSNNSGPSDLQLAGGYFNANSLYPTDTVPGTPGGAGTAEVDPKLKADKKDKSPGSDLVSDLLGAAQKQFGDFTKATMNVVGQMADQASAWTKKQFGIPEDAKMFMQGGKDGRPVQFGYTTSRVDDQGNTTDTRVTFTGAENSRREQTSVRDSQGRLREERDSFNSSDGSEWGEYKKYREDGSIEQEGRRYLDAEDGGGYQRTIFYDGKGGYEVSQGKFDDNGRVDSVTEKVAPEDIAAVQARLGPNGKDLLVKAGNGNEIFGLLSIKALGEGNIEKGLDRLGNFGDTPEKAIDRLRTFGSGDMQEAVLRFERVGDGKMELGFERLTRFGGGNLNGGMHRLEHLGSHTGNAGLGIDNIKLLARGYDFEAGMKNLLDIAKSNGGTNYADAIRFLDEMGAGVPERTIKALIKFGNGDAGQVTQYATRLGDGDAKKGYGLLIGKMADGGNMLDAVRHFHKLDSKENTETALAQLERHPKGCVACVNGLCRLGTDREGREHFEHGVEARNRFDGRTSGEPHDTDLAEENFRKFSMKPGDPPGSEPEYDPDWGVEQALALTRDTEGTVNGLEAAPNIASLDDLHGDFNVGMTILSRASDNGLPGEGVTGILAAGDDQTLDSAKYNLRLASSDNTVANGVEQVRHFANNGDSYNGGLSNLRLVDPTGTMQQRIRDVMALDNTDDGVTNFEGGTANLHKINPKGTIEMAIGDLTAFGDPDANGERRMRDGTANLLSLDPTRQIDQNIASVIGASDTVNGEQTFAGGTANVQRVDLEGKISDNLKLITNFDDKEGGLHFDGGMANIRLVGVDRQPSQNIDSIKNFGDNLTFAGGTDNLRRVAGADRDISNAIGSVHNFSDRDANGQTSFDGGTANLHRMSPDAPLSANIDRVYAFSDLNASGQHTFDGGTANIRRIDGDSQISGNIDRVIGFADNAPGGKTWDGGAANIALITPGAPTSANIDRVKAFGDGGISASHAWDGGVSNLRLVNPGAENSANIASVTNFGDKNAQGQRTWDGGVENLRAISPNGPMSGNITTVINFGDTAGGTKTFDSGRQNIQAVNQSGTIRENINAVAAFSDRPGATFADGAQNLGRMTNTDGQMSGAIKNVQNLSSDGTFTGGTQVMRTAGGGSVEKTITAMQTLAPNGNMSQAVESVKAAGQGNAERGFEAIRAFGGNDLVAGAQRLQQAVPNITPQQIEALAAAGNGKLEIGLARIQQAGGFDKVAAASGGNLLAGAQQVRQHAEAAEQTRIQQEAATALAAKNSVIVSSGDSNTSGTAYRPTGVVEPVRSGNNGTGEVDEREESAHRVYAVNMPVVHPAGVRDHDGVDVRPGIGPDGRPIVVVAPGTVAPRRDADSGGVTNYGVLPAPRVSLARVGADAMSPVTASTMARTALTTATTSLSGRNDPAVPLSGLERQLTAANAQSFLSQLSQRVAAETTAVARLNATTLQPFAHLLAGVACMDAARVVNVSLATAAQMSRLTQISEARHVAMAAATQQLLVHNHRAGVAAHLSEVEKIKQIAAAQELLTGRAAKGGDGPLSTNAHVVRIGKQGALIAFNPAGGQALDVRIGRYPLKGAIDIGGLRSQQLVFAGTLPTRGKKLALIGPEIALAALFISAGVARARGADKAAAEKALQLKQAQAQAEAEAHAEKLNTKDDDDDARKKVHKYDPRIRPSWLVRPGEDLCKLADHLFHDAKLGWLIADINIANINEMFDGKKRVVELRVRQKIELPVWQDIVEFHKLKNDFEISDLITVVTDTAIEQELMQSTLAPVLGVASAGAATPATATGVVGAPGMQPAAAAARTAEAQPASAGAAAAAAAGAGTGLPQPATASLGAAIPAALAALANAGAALAGLHKQDPTATAAATAAEAAISMAQSAAKNRQGTVVQLPALNAARIAADVTLTGDKFDPTAVATATDAEDIPATSTSGLKPKYA